MSEHTIRTPPVARGRDRSSQETAPAPPGAGQVARDADPAPAARGRRPKGGPAARDPGLDDPIRSLTGVGPRRAELLARLGIHTPRDLLTTLPRSYTDRRRITTLSKLRPGERGLVIVDLVRAAVRRRRGGRSDTVATVRDASGSMDVVWWGQPFLMRSLRPGMRLALYGEVSVRGRPVIDSPELEVQSSSEAGQGGGLSFVGRIVPTYGLTEGLSQRWMRELARRVALDRARTVEETLPESIRARLALPGLGEAIETVHAPESLAAAERARRRLVLDELLEVMLALGIKRHRRRTELPGLSQVPGPGFEALLAGLPFTLTGAQRQALDEILADMARPSPMHRLLEGDVGTGKTVVALLAAIVALDSGGQVAIMAPTEILAAQHARTVLRLFPSLRPLVLTGAAGVRERSTLLAALARGDGRLAIGTHALFSKDVRFRRLTMVVVDEQHRFGVRERAALAGKGAYPDVLVMTATPIPRTLALTVFGDLDLSVIEERPPGRPTVRTHIVEDGRREKVYRFLAERLGGGEQAFLITPRIEAEPQSELAAATVRAEELRRHPLLSRHSIGLLHGRLPAEEKEAVMGDYRRGKLSLLVSTTVVEVGIDVGTATVMVVEHPERFGLSQLHQLRGRVGRGARAAHVILLTDPGLEPEVRARLEAFARTDDGFQVAELDLESRGPGALLGVEQHGFGGFRVADPLRHRELIVEARELAEELVAADPEMTGSLGRAVRRRGGGRLPDPGLGGLAG